MQFLSEPSGGSDLAGCLTRADRDGDVFIMNGSKIWSSGAAESDYAMCLARTNWDVPKHRGLTMFIVKIHQPGIQVEQIRQVDGSMEFCQEFFDDVAIPASRRRRRGRRRLDGRHPPARPRAQRGRRRLASTRAVATRATTPPPTRTPTPTSLERPDAQATPTRASSSPRPTSGSWSAASSIRRVTQGVTAGKMAPPAGSLLKLFSATNVMRRYEIGLELAGGGCGRLAAPTPSRSAVGFGEISLWRQGLSLGGGSNEIQRNIISERLLGMPREFAADREVPYRDVPRGAAGNRA